VPPERHVVTSSRFDGNVALAADPLSGLTGRNGRCGLSRRRRGGRGLFAQRRQPGVAAQGVRLVEEVRVAGRRDLHLVAGSEESVTELPVAAVHDLGESLGVLADPRQRDGTRVRGLGLGLGGVDGLLAHGVGRVRGCSPVGGHLVGDRTNGRLDVDGTLAVSVAHEHDGGVEVAGERLDAVTQLADECVGRGQGGVVDLLGRCRVVGGLCRRRGRCGVRTGRKGQLGLRDLAADDSLADALHEGAEGDLRLHGHRGVGHDVVERVVGGASGVDDELARLLLLGRPELGSGGGVVDRRVQVGGCLGHESFLFLDWSVRGTEGVSVPPSQV